MVLVQRAKEINVGLRVKKDQSICEVWLEKESIRALITLFDIDEYELQTSWKIRIARLRFLSRNHDFRGRGSLFGGMRDRIIA